MIEVFREFREINKFPSNSIKIIFLITLNLYFQNIYFVFLGKQVKNLII